MENKQKIWLAVSLLIFLIPEILWSPVRSLVYIFLHPDEFTDIPLLFNILPPPQDNFIIGLTGIIQFVGLLWFSFILLKSRFNKIIKILIGLFLIVLILISGLIMWMDLYYMFNTPQLG